MEHLVERIFQWRETKHFIEFCMQSFYGECFTSDKNHTVPLSVNAVVNADNDLSAGN